jgi:hypothetical protein
MEKKKKEQIKRSKEKEGWNKMLTLWFQRLCTISTLHISSYVKTLSSVHHQTVRQPVWLTKL